MILRISVYGHTLQVFDYLPDDVHENAFETGMRVLVPFKKKECVGLIVSVETHSLVDPKKLKPILKCLDSRSFFSNEMLELLRFASEYYHSPLGEVMWHALPKYLKRSRECEETVNLNGVVIARSRATKQSIHSGLLRRSAPRNDDSAQVHRDDEGVDFSQAWTLNNEQQFAFDHVERAFGKHQTFLLNGVTGSGKTEIYLHLAREVRKRGQSVLILVPEIGLTPQLYSRFQERFFNDVLYVHSGLTEKERFLKWRAIENQQVNIVIGTRSALFSPMKSLGLIIVDEEHDASFKQEERFRYHARDLAVMRAKIHSIPIVLASATPSLESLHRVQEKRYVELRLTERAGSAQLPAWHVIGVKKIPEHGISDAMQHAMRKHLEKNQHVLLFLNRRGYAPVWYCRECAKIADCKRCTAHMVVHQKRKRLICHHCEAEQTLYAHCPECQSENVQPIGLGTQRVEEMLSSLFQDVDVFRIDRDSTQKKGEFEAFLERIEHSPRAILLGTQMLAKGHHIDRLSMVGVIDADQSLLSADFRSKEYFGQWLTQVAGRSGRAAEQGEVYVQTRDPENAYMQLIQVGYREYAEKMLSERKELSLPPFSYLAVLRAESPVSHRAKQFLQECKTYFENVQVMGPRETWMVKKNGYFGWQLLLRSLSRPVLQRVLHEALANISKLPSARKLKWKLDVDPLQVS